MLRAFFELATVVGSVVLVYGALAVVIYLIERPRPGKH